MRAGLRYSSQLAYHTFPVPLLTEKHSLSSQSRVMVRSPSCFKSTTARMARPISRWISCVRPLWRPRLASRGVRVRVERGSMLYSAVIHPLPDPFIKPGTLSSMDAVQITRVLPTSISAEPSAVDDKFWNNVYRTHLLRRAII